MVWPLFFKARSFNFAQCWLFGSIHSWKWKLKGIKFNAYRNMPIIKTISFGMCVCVCVYPLSSHFCYTVIKKAVKIASIAGTQTHRTTHTKRRQTHTHKCKHNGPEQAPIFTDQFLTHTKIKSNRESFQFNAYLINAIWANKPQFGMRISNLAGRQQQTKIKNRTWMNLSTQKYPPNNPVSLSK